MKMLFLNVLWTYKSSSFFLLLFKDIGYVTNKGTLWECYFWMLSEQVVTFKNPRTSSQKVSEKTNPWTTYK